MAVNPGPSRSPGAPIPADGILAHTVREQLRNLIDASDALANALTRRDYDAIVAAVTWSESLVRSLGDLAKAVGDARAAGAFGRIDPELERLRDALHTASRRNAQLIERAWQTDASTLRLLASLGRHSTATGPGRVYTSTANPSYLDTPA
jgi:hypothetical protein